MGRIAARLSEGLAATLDAMPPSASRVLAELLGEPSREEELQRLRDDIVGALGADLTFQGIRFF